MLVLGLTGSIASGKSTTAAMFAEAGVPVFDADAAVHELYRGRAAPLIEAAFPGTVTDGVVDRPRLSAGVLGDQAAIARLEAIVHPLVREAESDFLESAAAAGHDIVVLDVPLLFETGGEGRVDRVVVTTAPRELRRTRALARPGMTPERLERLMARQTPDEDKRRRADFVIDTSHGVDHARHAVNAILAAILAEKRP